VCSLACMLEEDPVVVEAIYSGTRRKTAESQGLYGCFDIRDSERLDRGRNGQDLGFHSF